MFSSIDSSPEIANMILGKKLDSKLLQRLDIALKTVRVVLNDAEKKQITDSDVNNWLEDLKDAVYLADDLLDEVSTKAVTQKEVSKSNFFSRLFNVQDSELVVKLEDIVVRLEYILKLKECLNLKEIAMNSNFSYRAQSTSLEDGSRIYGRDEDKDKEAIIKLLLDDSIDGGEVSVIPIVGMGGVGKTTLAQLVYNDDDVEKIFDFRAWVCVSDEFDILKVTKTITEAVTRQTCATNDLNLLHLELQKKLREKKFLVVLDDVWIEDYINWNLLKKPFQHGIKGSKILVTTRSEKVASVVRLTVQPYHLNELSNEDCWLVFARHASLSLDSTGRTLALEKIGRKIVKKCKGLPLAAQSLGGMLQNKNDIRDWNNLLNSDIWELSESESIIIPALRISYHYLPPHLKRCFVYCSLFPKDYSFEKNELILLWMAEDLLPKPKNEKTLEEVGFEYSDYLVSRSFLQPSTSITGTNFFVMHDLVHDLATFLGGEFFFRSELGEEGKVSTKISIKARHLSFTNFNYYIYVSKICERAKFLRTLLPMNVEAFSFHNEMASDTILSKLKSLRVLSFKGFIGIHALPDSIGELIHLRYLNLSCTSIKTLPESLGNLYNLQTLILSRCSNLTELPTGMQNLVSLRHLDNSSTPLKEMPRGMSKLNHLQHLSYFIAGNHEENGIKEMRGLSNLRGSLCIRGLENVTSSSEALEARMMEKEHISSLSFQWSADEDCLSSQIEIDILFNLQPHQDLKSLSISGYRGTRFPDWLGNSSYHKMTDLSLSFCENCCMLPSLGQLPFLKMLVISNLNGLEIIDAGFYANDNSSSATPFPSLESLEFNNMPCWEMWSSFESDAFPQLKYLKIRDCPRLRGDLPIHLPALKILEINNCQHLASSLTWVPSIRELVNSDEVTKTVRRSSMYYSRPPPMPYLYSRHGFPSDSAESFLGGCLLASLETLHIVNFGKLELPKKLELISIKSLTIDESCGSLTTLPLETFPNLEHLHIRKCENLESISISQSHQNLSCSEIHACPNFVSFLREGLPVPNMIRFSIHNCDKLKSLPNQMGSFLPKLESLEIHNCPEIESFPEGGMPPKLRSIVITNCKKLLSFQTWPSMDMLTHLRINGPCDGIKSFPKDGLLPASLVSLQLNSFLSLEILESSGFLHLNSLQHLSIGNCPKLRNTTKEMLPSSLIEFNHFEYPLKEDWGHACSDYPPFLLPYDDYDNDKSCCIA